MANDLEADATVLRDWALDILHREDHTGPPDALHFLTSENYVLSAETTEAVRIIADPSNAPAWVLPRQRELVLCKAVADFAQVFFDIDPESRQARWAAIRKDCEDFPSARTWMEQLKGGLDVDRLPVSKNGDVASFVKSSCAVFVARPPECIWRRQELIALVTERQDVWDEALKELRMNHPQFVRAIVPWIDQCSRKKIDPRVAKANFQKNLPKQKSFFERIFATEASPKSWHWTIPFALVYLLAQLHQLVTKHSQPPAGTITQWQSIPQITLPYQPANDSAVADALHPDNLPTTENVANQKSYFESLQTSSPETFDRMCREIQGLRISVANPGKRAILDRYVASLLPELDQQIRSRYRVDRRDGPDVDQRSATRPVWLKGLSTLAEKAIKSTVDADSASALAPENGPVRP